MRPRLPLAAALVALALLTAGCGDGGGSAPAGGWPSADPALDRSGLVYAAGDSVHLGDGTVLPVGKKIDRFVLAGGGVFFTAGGHETGGDDSSYVDPLYYSAGDGRLRKVAPDATELRVSADGRYLMYLDLESGREDGFGTPQGEIVVVDAVEGREVVRTSKGMGDPDSDDDLADLYEDAEPRLEGFAEGAAYYRGATDEVVIELPAGTVRVRDDDQPSPVDERRSPDGRWTIEDRYEDSAPQDRLLTAAGRAVPLTGVRGKINLEGWTGDTTVTGYIVARASEDVEPADAPLPLVVCEATTGHCSVLPGPTARDVQLPEGGHDD